MAGFIIFLLIGLIGTVFGLMWNKPLLIFLGGFGVAFMLHFAIGPRISAIDVYRGKTTLEITYRNGVVVDSVVVFKTK